MTNSANIFDSKATHVTLFEDRAEVQRTVTLPIDAGLSWVKIRGASLFVDDRSVQARPLSEGFSVLGVRVVRRFVYTATLGHEARQALQAEGEALLRQREVRLTTKQRIEQKQQHLNGLVQAWAKILQSNVKIGQSPDDTTKESFEVLQAELFAALRESQLNQEELRKVEESYQNLVARLREADQKRPSYESLIEVQLSADAAHAEASLALHYFTPGALWRPEHAARLRVDPADHQKGSIEITTFASTWQRTGEDWDQVTASFSTARPAREASPPLLRSEVLDLRKKTEEEKQQIIVEAREQTVQTVAASSTPSQPQVSEMPGVDDGGQPLLYSPSEKVSLISDGQPFRVEIGKLTLPCEVGRVLFPEKAPVAYLRAKATLSGQGPLLAGPVQLAREAGFVGKNKLDFIGPGDRFELGFGIDDAVRVRRQSKEQRESSAITGSQKVRRTVNLWISNLSEETRTLEVVERIPVSEIEDLEVFLVESDGARHDPKDGFLTKALTLGPLATSASSIVYEIKAPAKVRIPDAPPPPSLYAAKDMDF